MNVKAERLWAAKRDGLLRGLAEHERLGMMRAEELLAAWMAEADGTGIARSRSDFWALGEQWIARGAVPRRDG